MHQPKACTPLVKNKEIPTNLLPKFHDKRHTTYIRYFHFFSWSQGKNITKPFLIEGKINAQTSWRECGLGTLDLNNEYGDERKVIGMAFLEDGQLWVFFVPDVSRICLSSILCQRCVVLRLDLCCYTQR